jgi:hypothetical protein
MLAKVANDRKTMVRRVAAERGAEIGAVKVAGFFKLTTKGTNTQQLPRTGNLLTG